MVGREKLELLNAKSKNCDKLKYKKIIHYITVI